MLATNIFKYAQYGCSEKMTAPSKRLVIIDLLKHFGMWSTKYLGRTQIHTRRKIDQPSRRMQTLIWQPLFFVEMAFPYCLFSR